MVYYRVCEAWWKRKTCQSISGAEKWNKESLFETGWLSYWIEKGFKISLVPEGSKQEAVLQFEFKEAEGKWTQKKFILLLF